MIAPRPTVATVDFVDVYCNQYQYLFSDKGNFEAINLLHIGIISEIKRKFWLAIALRSDYRTPNSSNIVCSPVAG